MTLAKIIKEHKNGLIALAAGVVVLGIMLIVLYATAPSTVTVPKAEQHEINANIETQQATTAEAQANVIRGHRIEAHAETERSKGTLKERKAQYDKTRTTNNSNGVNGANLDPREHQLQSDLEGLYPANR